MNWFCLLLICCLQPLQAEYRALSQLVSAAEGGDLEAKIEWAHRCLDSLGDTRDPEVIYAAFSEGAEAGYADAYAGLALCHSRGFGTEKDAFEAYRLAKVSADLGSAKGYCALGRIAMAGQPVSGIRDRIQEYLKKAAAMGSHEARYLLASYRFSKDGYSRIIVDPEELKKLAEEGHEGAMFGLSSYYKNDDPALADQYLQRLLKTGYPSAWESQAFGRYPGQSFRGIDNTREENAKALASYRRAALRGDRHSIFTFSYGLFLHPELAQKNEDWRQIMGEAARLGSIEACDILAWSYYEPTKPGEDPDYARAEELLLRTLDQPNRGRYHTLGLIYANGGFGVEKNPERAFKLLGKFADEIPYVYRMLGKILTDWEPLQGNEAYKIRAYACYLRYQKTVPEPREGLFEERTQPLGLSAAQIAEAQKLADDGYPTKPEHTLWVFDDGPYSPESLARDAVTAYRVSGKDGMWSLLSNRFDEFYLARPRSSVLFGNGQKRYLRLFKEAQTGSGRNDPHLAADLYEWLFDHTEQYPVSFSRFNIVNNFAHALGQSGQRGRAKRLLAQVAEFLKISGYDTDLLSHPKNSPFEEFPLVNVPDYREVERLGLDLTAFLSQLAEQGLVEGRWEDALAQAQGHFEVVLHKIESDPGTKKNIGEWRNQVVASRDSKARVFDLLQFYERADELYELNATDESSKTYGGRSRHTAKVDLARNRIRRGDVDTAMIGQLVGLEKLIGRHKLLTLQDRHEAIHTTIMAHFSLGERDKAWNLLERTRAKFPKNLSFNLLWVEQKMADGNLAGLEEILISQLQAVRRQGEKVSESKLYLLYARFLQASGRIREAIQMQFEAIRLLESFDLYTWLPNAHLDLADFLALLGNEEGALLQRKKAEQILKSGRVFPGHIVRDARENLARELPSAQDDEAPTGADLQPLQQVCLPLVGFEARGLFVLRNPSGQSLEGQLQVTGIHRELVKGESDNEYQVWIETGDRLPKTSPVNLSLEAGGEVFLEIATNDGGIEKADELKIRWLPKSGSLLESSWRYEPAEGDGVQNMVVDASVYQENPFYNVPIFHLVQSQNGFDEPIDLRIVASQDARIEVYDEESELVLIDGNGDGDLNDPGDLLVIDENSDGYGDLNVSREGARSSRFFMLITPAKKLSEEGVSVSLQNRKQGGRWEEVLLDRILPRAK